MSSVNSIISKILAHRQDATSTRAVQKDICAKGDLDDCYKEDVETFFEDGDIKQLLEELTKAVLEKPKEPKKRIFCCATTTKNEECSKTVSENSKTGKYCEVHIYCEKKKNKNEKITNNECRGSPKKSTTNKTGICKKKVSIYSET